MVRNNGGNNGNNNGGTTTVVPQLATMAVTTTVVPQLATTGNNGNNNGGTTREKNEFAEHFAVCQERRTNLRSILRSGNNGNNKWQQQLWYHRLPHILRTMTTVVPDDGATARGQRRCSV